MSEPNMTADVQPLILTPQRDADGVYRSLSADKKALMDLDPVAKEIILKWNPDEPGTVNLACISFFRGYELYVLPLDKKEVLTDEEDQFLDAMAIAYELVRRIFVPPDIAVH